MVYEKTELNFLERDCILQFGEKGGARIFRRASKLYAELVVTTDYKNDRLLEKQLKGLVYPVICARSSRPRPTEPTPLPPPSVISMSIRLQKKRRIALRGLTERTLCDIMTIVM